MPVKGDLQTMPLVELLQWLAANEKTGVLELERNKIRKQISFRGGRIVACFSNDPSTRFGQFLISRGKITGRTLEYALEQQKATGRDLPSILVDMGVITEEEVKGQVATKAVETIYGMFEWEDAIFRFELETARDRYHIEVDLSVNGILLNGAQRQDELREVRKVFTSSGIVLRRTDRPMPSDVEDGPLAFHVLELVDAERTLAEVLVGAHASEYHVLKLLFELHKKGCIEIVEERSSCDSGPTLIDVRPDGAPLPLPNADQFREPSADAVPAPAEAADADPPEFPTSSAEGAPIEETDLPVLLQIAVEKTDRGEHEGALVILDACYEARPHDESLQKQMLRSESAFLEEARRDVLQPEKVPVQAAAAEALAEPLRPAETSLLHMMDGQKTIQSILWVAPLSELQIARALRRLLQRGLIRLEDSPPAAGDIVADSGDAVAVEADPAAELTPTT